MSRDDEMLCAQNDVKILRKALERGGMDWSPTTKEALHDLLGWVENQLKPSTDEFQDMLKEELRNHVHSAVVMALAKGDRDLVRGHLGEPYEFAKRVTTKVLDSFDAWWKP